MKKILVFIIVAISSVNVYSQYKLIDSNNGFAFKIYKATKPDSSNFFISPFSLNIALSIANEGAKAATRDEMNKLLSIGDIENTATSYKAMISKITNLKDSDYYNCIRLSRDKSGGNTLFIANALWINSDSKIENSYLQTIKDDYYSDIFEFEKNNIATENQKLKDWVSDKTKNKIKEIPVLDPSIKLSIINAIYFRGEWDIAFKKEKTKEKIFHTISDDKIKTDFMNSRTQNKYFEDSDIQGIFLPYKCDQLSMLVLLPKGKFGINKFEQLFNLDYLLKIQKASSYKEVILSFPKFKIESEIFPMEQIFDMGYHKMFSSKADFTSISATDSLRIGNIVHKTFIEIDEKKTEAAALSEIVLIGYGVVDNPPPPPPPKIFNANHPFIFLIIDNRTNAIVFMGRFVK